MGMNGAKVWEKSTDLKKWLSGKLEIDYLPSRRKIRASKLLEISVVLFGW